MAKWFGSTWSTSSLRGLIIWKGFDFAIKVIGGVFGVWSVILVAVPGGIATGQSEGGITGIIVAMSLAAISERAVRGDPRDLTLRRFGHRLTRRWGTRFVDAVRTIVATRRRGNATFAPPIERPIVGAECSGDRTTT